MTLIRDNAIATWTGNAVVCFGTLPNSKMFDQFLALYYLRNKIDDAIFSKRAKGCSFQTYLWEQENID